MKFDSLEEGKVYKAAQLADLARELREDAGDTQEDVAVQLEVDQAIVSKAEKGERKYRLTCVRMVELYTQFSVEYPLYRLSKKKRD